MNDAVGVRMSVRNLYNQAFRRILPVGYTERTSKPVKRWKVGFTNPFPPRHGMSSNATSTAPS